MSRVPTRPAAPRRPAGPPSSGGQTTERAGQSLDEIRALPDFVDEGQPSGLDPAEASSGRIVEEVVTVVSAKFVKQDWKRKDGTYPEGSSPVTQLQLELRRDGDEEGDRPYKQEYEYGRFERFAPTKDGNSVGVRPSLVKRDKDNNVIYVPKPRKLAPAILFLDSLKTAAGQELIEKIKKDGISAIVGLRLGVRSRKVEGMSEKSRPVLLVDFVDVDVPGANKPSAPKAPAAPSKQAETRQAPAATAPAAQAAPAAAAASAAVSSNVEELATEALVEALQIADGNTIGRAAIPAAIIRIDRWKNSPDRGQILKVLRGDAFITGSAKWIVDGNNVILA